MPRLSRELHQRQLTFESKVRSVVARRIFSGSQAPAPGTSTVATSPCHRSRARAIPVLALNFSQRDVVHPVVNRDLELAALDASDSK
jgi:hypothetical protein